MVKLVVGLGNPGLKYAKTRHNLGWMALDFFADKHGVLLNQRGYQGLFGERKWRGSSDKVILLKPVTFMNLSGLAVASAMAFYKISAADILVIYDDLDLPLGKLRLREKGGAGGHNGVKSIIQEIGTQEFARLKLGIGRPAPGWEVVDWVLSSFGPDEASGVVEVVARAANAVECFLDEGIVKAMTKHNG